MLLNINCSNYIHLYSVLIIVPSFTNLKSVIFKEMQVKSNQCSDEEMG